MKWVELTDVATNATGAVDLGEVAAMEEVPGPAGTKVTRLTFGGGDWIEVYETIEEIMQLLICGGNRCPCPGRCTKASSSQGPTGARINRTTATAAASASSRPAASLGRGR
jgi:hypothetical protein